MFSLKQLFAGKKDVFGLDIGSSYVKAVQLHQDENGYKLASAERVEIIKERSNSRAKLENFIMAIRKCVKSAQIKSKYAVCGVCGPDVATRSFRFPPLPEEEIRNAVLFEAEQVCPFDKGQFVLDYQLIHNGTAHAEQSDNSKQASQTYGVLVATTPRIIGWKSRLVRAASLNCVLMDADGLALLNCFSGCEKPEPDQTTAILDVGSAFANLAILHGGGLPFTRDIFHAGDQIIDYISREHDIAPQAVKSILTRSHDKGGDVEELGSSLAKACTGLIADIIETLRYYVAQEGNAVDRILLCGGFAQVNGFSELLGDHLPSKVVLWNPLSKMRYDYNAHGVNIVEEYGPSLALAAGLAMRTI